MYVYSENLDHVYVYLYVCMYVYVWTMRKSRGFLTGPLVVAFISGSEEEAADIDSMGSPTGRAAAAAARDPEPTIHTS